MVTAEILYIHTVFYGSGYWPLFLAMAVCRVRTCLSVLDAFGMVGGARISRLRMANRTQAVANGASMAEEQPVFARQFRHLGGCGCRS